jgi:hypothetical protein
MQVKPGKEKARHLAGLPNLVARGRIGPYKDFAPLARGEIRRALPYKDFALLARGEIRRALPYKDFAPLARGEILVAEHGTEPASVIQAR